MNRILSKETLYVAGVVLATLYLVQSVTILRRNVVPNLSNS